MTDIGATIIGTTDLLVGRHRIPFDTARDWVAEYTADGATRYGYPAYETYLASGRPKKLNDADLLAPNLLNAAPSLKAFYWLREQLPTLNTALAAIPETADIADTSLSLELLDPLFAVLDDPGRAGVGMTSLSKVLHRKRPGFIPLWDSKLRSCYSTGDDAPVRLVRNRAHGPLAVDIATAMRDDLTAAPDAWTRLAALPDNPPITPLRALDIVAWSFARRQELAAAS